MSISERVSYLKGLADGMKISDDSNEGKLLKEIISLLADMCDEIDAIDDAQIELAEQLDAVDEDLAAIEEIVYEDFEECDGDCEDCDLDCEFNDFDDDDEVYEMTCPKCNDIVYVDNEMLSEGDINCPNCGEKLDFDFEGCDGNCEECGAED